MLFQIIERLLVDHPVVADLLISSGFDLIPFVRGVQRILLFLSEQLVVAGGDLDQGPHNFLGVRGLRLGAFAALAIIRLKTFDLLQGGAHLTCGHEPRRELGPMNVSRLEIPRGPFTGASALLFLGCFLSLGGLLNGKVGFGELTFERLLLRANAVDGIGIGVQLLCCLQELGTGVLWLTVDRRRDRSSPIGFLRGLTHNAFHRHRPLAKREHEEGHQLGLNLCALPRVAELPQGGQLQKFVLASHCFQRAALSNKATAVDESHAGRLENIVKPLFPDLYNVAVIARLMQDILHLVEGRPRRSSEV